MPRGGCNPSRRPQKVQQFPPTARKLPDFPACARPGMGASCAEILQRRAVMLKTLRLLPLLLACAAPVAAQSLTFTKDVAPILQKSCQGCHRPGQMAPMALLT